MVTGMDYARFIFGEPAAEDNDVEMDFATSSSEDEDGEPESPGRGPPLITPPMKDVSRHPVMSDESGRSATPESIPPKLVFFLFPACSSAHVIVFVLGVGGCWLTCRTGDLTLSSL